jgi:hypothetical protein
MIALTLIMCNLKVAKRWQSMRFREAIGSPDTPRKLLRPQRWIWTLMKMLPTAASARCSKYCK